MHGSLRARQRRWRFCRQRSGERIDLARERVGGNDAIEEADAMRFGGGDHLARQHHLHRAAEAREQRKEERRAEIRMQANPVEDGAD